MFHAKRDDSVAQDHFTFKKYAVNIQNNVK